MSTPRRDRNGAPAGTDENCSARPREHRPGTTTGVMAARPEPWVGAVTYRFGRAIGPWGTIARLVAGGLLAAYALAVPHEHPLLAVPGAGLLWSNAVLGLLLIPAAATLALRLRGRAAAPLAAGIRTEITFTVVFLAALQVLPVALLLALTASLLVQVLRGDGGCEVLAIPNWLLQRQDRLFCVIFTPLDGLEARARRRRPRNGP